VNWRRRIDLRDLEKAIVLGLFVALALLMRFFLRRFVSSDMASFFLPWLSLIQKQGLLAFRSDFGGLSPLFPYLLGVAGLLVPPISRILAVKLISIAFDLVCSFFVYRLVSLRSPRGYAPVLALIAVLFAPTVVLNSSLWGQNDMIYTAGLVACVYFLATGRDWASALSFGLALAVKLQAVFLAPLLVALFSRRALSWKALLLIPVPYLVSILPAWAVGRPLPDLLTIYFHEAVEFPKLSFNAPTLYAWIPNQFYADLFPASLVFASAMVCLYVLAVFKSRIPLSAPRIVQLATFSVLFLPFILPEMHERYFFAADVLSIVFAFYFPSYFFIPILVGSVSFFSYLPSLLNVTVFSYSLLALIQLGTIVLLARHMVTTLFPSENQTASAGSLAVPPNGAG